MLARRWLGLAARWIGPGASAPVTDLLSFALPVVVVGHDGPDGGGMTLASLLATNLAASDNAVLELQGGESGAVVWALQVYQEAVLTSQGFVRLYIRRDPYFGPGATDAQVMRPLTRSMVKVGEEPMGNAPASGFARISVPPMDPSFVVEFARPIVLEPRENLLVWTRDDATGADASIGIYFEEGF